jgi:hypothetical protein
MDYFDELWFSLSWRIKFGNAIGSLPSSFVLSLV